MNHFVLRTLFRQPRQTLLGCVAISAVFTVVLAFEGFRGGVVEQMRAFPLNCPRISSRSSAAT